MNCYFTKVSHRYISTSYLRRTPRTTHNAPRMPSAMEFMQRLAALMPRPRLHLIRFGEVLASNAKLRKAMMPVPQVATALAHVSDGDHTPAGSVKGRMRWALLLKRVFDIDIEQCPHCGGN